MEYTNNHELPEFIHNGLTRNTYNRDGIKFDISATKLIDSPQIAELWKENGKTVTEDSMDRVWSAWGTAVHDIFETANKANPDVLMEKRFRSKYYDKVVAGQIDAYEIPSKTLSDIKTCGSFKVVKGDTRQWENQLNVCAQLMRDNGYEVEKLQIVAIIKDWTAFKAKKEKGYPQHPIVVIPIKLWPSESAKDYILSRVKIHFDDTTKICSDEERWIRPGKLAIMKKGRKSAIRLVDTEDQVKEYLEYADLVGHKDVYVEERKSSYARCEGFCPFGKMGICPQLLKEEQKHGKSE